MAQTRKDPDIGAIKEDLAALKRSIEDLADEFSRAGDSTIGNTAEQFGETLKKLRNQINEVVHEATARGRKSAETVTTSMTEHPVQSLVLAFAAGMIMAQFLKRR